MARTAERTDDIGQIPAGRVEASTTCIRHSSRVADGRLPQRRHDRRQRRLLTTGMAETCSR
jgi:hypothetical protein